MLAEHPHRRLNILTGEWVLVSPHRTQRPWQGQRETISAPPAIPYDADCYLCPTNQRVGGIVNPAYTDTFYFDNDFAALYPAFTKETYREEMLVAEGERGICRVICFSPRHDLTLATMTPAEIMPVVDLWAQQAQELGALELIKSVQIFENRGAMMGASNPHPHCQIWASETIPNELAKETASCAAYRDKNSSACLLCDYLRLELRLGERIVCANQSFVALVPFWAIYPFETLVLPQRHLSGLEEMTAAEKHDLADILHRLTVRYDNLFETPFPYSMGFHLAPADGNDNSFFHAHAHFYPPLLRSATVRKFLVGFEILGSPQRDITPETAAANLRQLSEQHYLNRS